MSVSPTLHLILIRHEGDEASFSPRYQAELRQFYSLARAEGNTVNALRFSTDSASIGNDLTGEFTVPFSRLALPTLAKAADAWLRGRAGRRLRVVVGGIDVEATHSDEVMGVLNLTIAVMERTARDSG